MDDRKESRGEVTRIRIICAAGELFAEKGFKGTTTRDICTQADTNNAAVNYYFRDKESLFAEVIRYGFRAAHEKYPPDYNFENTKDANERLRQFIWNMLIPRHDPDLPKWFPQLMSRNIQFAHDYIIPLVLQHKQDSERVLGVIIAELTGNNLSPYRTGIAAAGIIGSILFHMRPHHHDDPEPVFPIIESREDFEKFVDHVCAFSLGGIDNLKDMS